MLVSGPMSGMMKLFSSDVATPTMAEMMGVSAEIKLVSGGRTADMICMHAEMIGVRKLISGGRMADMICDSRGRMDPRALMSGGSTVCAMDMSGGPTDWIRPERAGPTLDTRGCSIWRALVSPEKMSDPVSSGRSRPSVEETVFHMPARASDSAGATASNAPESASGRFLASDCAILCTTGPTFLATLSTDSMSWSVSAPMSASSRPSPVSQFDHAAFMVFTEPSMVVAASRAVVPVMPMFSCTAWMAVMTSENLLGSRACPVSSDASLTRRSSSDFVPP